MGRSLRAGISSLRRSTGLLAWGDRLGRHILAIRCDIEIGNRKYAGVIGHDADLRAKRCRTLNVANHSSIEKKPRHTGYIDHFDDIRAVKFGCIRDGSNVLALAVLHAEELGTLIGNHFHQANGAIRRICRN